MAPNALRILLVAATLLGPAAAAAQEDYAERAARARALFEDGVELARAGDLDQAIDRFRRAHALRPAPGIAFNLASALARANHPVEASEWLRRVLGDPAADDGMRTAANRLLQEQTPRIGRLTVQVTGPREGTVFRLDGEELDAAVIGVEVPIDPGAHVITAERSGTEVDRAEVSIDDAGTAEATLDLPPLPEPEPEPEPEPDPIATVVPEDDGDERGIASRWWFWTILAAVAAGGAVAAVFLLQGDPPPPIDGNTSPTVLRWR